MLDAKIKNSYPLRVASEQNVVTITELKGNQQFKDSCINQGLVPGQKLEILNNSGNGPCVVACNSSRVMIGSGMLNRIFVTEN